jgi:hypothetical protein
MRTRPIWSKTGATSATPIAVALPRDWTSLKIETDVRSFAQLGAAYTPPAVAAVNGITTLTSLGGPTGGTFQIRVLDRTGRVVETTAAIPYNESAANIKTALVALASFETGDITAAGGALPTAVTLTWTGVWAAAAPPLEIVNAVTGGTNARINAAITTQPAGNGGYVYVVAGAQEVWEADEGGIAGERYIYLATTTGAGNYYVSAFR